MITDFFSEISFLLNDIKPDDVAILERTYFNEKTEDKETEHTNGIILKRSKGQNVRYSTDNDFRIVVCLREDKLYLLERSSANIPCLKTNRYNLHALSPQNAIEVVMCPRPDLFSNEEAIAIVNKIADMGEEGVKTIDPAILSLFLYKYFEKQGKTNYDNIFADYYKEATQHIKTESIAYLENHLLTFGGYRNQIPLDDAINSGVTHSEIERLLDKIILRTEKRKNIDYIEFSHDRLCEEAKHSRDERNIFLQRKAARRKMIIGGLVIIALCFVVFQFALQNSKLENNRKELEQYNKELEQKKNELDKLLAEKNAINILLETEMVERIKNSDSLRASLLRIGIMNRSLSIANDSMRALYNDNRKKDETIQSYERTYGLKVQEGLKENINIQNIREQTSTNRAISQSLSEVKEHCTVQTLMQKFYTISCMISEGKTFPHKLVNELKDQYAYFASLRQISHEKYSCKGHIVFDYQFLYDLGFYGNSIYNKADEYEKNIPLITRSGILSRTCLIKGSSTETYQFVSKGFQEIAIVSEANGLVSLRVHVTNRNGMDKWYGDDCTETKGSAFKYISFSDSETTFNHVTLEVKNCTNKDITCAIISN